jgi:hypothetical protein
VRRKPVLLLPVLVALAAAVVVSPASPEPPVPSGDPSLAEDPFLLEPVPRPVKNKVPRYSGTIAPRADLIASRESVVRIWTIRYRAHNGTARQAYVILPIWYGPERNPRLPFVISPHGRGVSALTNARLWRGLPGRGEFAVISPEGTGRELARYSWGALGQIDDLARMPTLARRALPWLRIDDRRVYALGGSMGGQETLLLLARHPKLLAGAAAFDSVTDFARQYRSFPTIPCSERCRYTWKGHIGYTLQRFARRELGGSPRTRPDAYAARSPISYARAIAASCVPLQLWWSRFDRIVSNQASQSGALFREIRRLNPRAPVQAFVGYWNHSVEMDAGARLPAALAELGLLKSPQPRRLTSGLHHLPPPDPGRSCGRTGETTPEVELPAGSG